MIFAAGLGTRLFPITKDRPKALAPFGGTTLLAYNLLFLSRFGINDFVINTHHFADKIESYLRENNNFGCNIQLSNEPNLLDTAGGLAKAVPFFADEEDILLYNVDVVSSIDIKAFYDYHRKNNSSATLAVRSRNTSRYLLFDNENKLVGWRNKSSNEEKWCDVPIESVNEYAFSGIHFINRRLFELLQPQKQSLTPFYLQKGAGSKILAFNHDNDIWFDCGKVENLKKAEEIITK